MNSELVLKNRRLGRVDFWGRFGRSGGFMLVLLVMVLGLQVAVFATEPGTVLTVDTTLNVQAGQDGDEGDDAPSTQSTEHTDPAQSAEIPWAWHPISVVNEPMNGFNAVRKTYALPPDVNPAVISTEDIQMFGQRFTFAYVLQQPTTSESFKEMRQTITIETRTRNLDDILANLEQEIWYDRDGFAGALILDIHSISTAAAGTTQNTTTATRQRTFPHLSSPDNSFIPRSIEDSGTTFYLTSVDWQSVGSQMIDGLPSSSSFTAHATYSAQVTQTRTTGYTTTAEFVGNVFRTTQGMTLFTAVFYGEPIVEVWLDVENSGGVNSEASDGVSSGASDGAGGGANGGASENDSNSNLYSAQPSTQNPTNPQTAPPNGNASLPMLHIIGIALALGVLGVGGFFAVKHFKGSSTGSVNVYSINSPREIVKAGKIKIDLASPEPIIVLNDTVARTPAKTDRYIIQLAHKTTSRLIGKALRVILHDKEAVHQVPDTAASVPVYEFEVNFSDDEDETG